MARCAWPACARAGGSITPRSIATAAPAWKLPRTLGRLAAVTAQDGTGLLVAILPELHRINGEYPFEKEQRKIADYLASRRIRTIDLLGCLRGHGPETGLWVTPADAHPSVKANALIAGCVGAGIPSPR